jgi:hypothetical protein
MSQKSALMFFTALLALYLISWGAVATGAGLLFSRIPTANNDIMILSLGFIILILVMDFLLFSGLSFTFFRRTTAFHSSAVMILASRD